MNEYKNKPVLMAAVYVIMILCFAVAAFSGIVVAYNLSNQYYSAGGNASDDIGLICMDRAYEAIDEAIAVGDYYDYDKNGEVTGLMKKRLSNEELISGESSSSDFGYVIRKGTNTIKRVNTKLIKAYSDGRRDIAKRTYHYEDEAGESYKIDIYIYR